MVQIEEYQLAWNRPQGPAFRFRVQGTEQWTGWIYVPAAEFTAVALILKETQVYYNPQTRAIFTGEEATGPQGDDGDGG